MATAVLIPADPQPEPPSKGVLLELTYNEARVLRALMGITSQLENVARLRQGGHNAEADLNQRVDCGWNVYRALNSVLG